MGEIIMIIGGLAILFGAFELLEADYEDWKDVAVKVVGGAVVAGIGVLMKYLGV